MYSWIMCPISGSAKRLATGGRQLDREHVPALLILPRCLNPQSIFQINKHAIGCQDIEWS